MSTNCGARFERKILPSSKKFKEDSRPGPSECAGRVPGGGYKALREGCGQKARPGSCLGEGVQILPLTWGAASRREGVRALSGPLSPPPPSGKCRVPDLPYCPLCAHFTGGKLGLGEAPHTLCTGGPLFKPEGVPLPCWAAKAGSWASALAEVPALSLASSHQGPSPEISPPPAWGSAHCAFPSKTVSIDSRSTFAKPSPVLPLPGSETIFCNLLDWGVCAVRSTRPPQGRPREMLRPARASEPISTLRTGRVLVLALCSCSILWM